MNLQESLLDSFKSKSTVESMNDLEQLAWLQGSFLFAFIWTICGTVDLKGRAVCCSILPICVTFIFASSLFLSHQHGEYIGHCIVAFSTIDFQFRKKRSNFNLIPFKDLKFYIFVRIFIYSSVFSRYIANSNTCIV